ncbi:sporulation protein YqfD [Evansella tamaricis]|uniref:Sporulation protein YqfD n=1 Tax=Evansella tamaricis TaxID=2069301 RepID=A0ABS6JFR1_9BACI|nr:sporulation protein YqfD [Evansella tamaricis]MBU9712059.1 sporulation protein YqfD [Evansella tamaricis]
MKNQWLHKVTGYVRIKITGAYPEMFINRCIDQKLMIWNINHVGKDVLVCSVLLDEVKYLRQLARVSDCKINFIERRGFPFFIRKLWKRNGLLFGGVGFLFLLYMLSNMVWGVEIEGASPQVEHELRQAVTELGIRNGAFQFRIPPPEEIQSIVTDEIMNATWIGVTRKGTTYHFQVVEKELAEREPEEAPGHLVATRKAVIYDLFVEEGRANVERNQVVEKGDLLVSGLIGKEGEELKVSAKGTVLGEIWFEAGVTVPLSQTLYAATGERYRTHYLHIGNVKLPFWGWNPPEYVNNKKEIFESSWSIFGLQLPFYYGYRDLLETYEIEVEEAIEEAIEIGKKTGKDKLSKEFSEDAEITGEKVLHHEVEDGKVKVIIHYRIVDEIAEKQPIIQGD